MDPDANLRRQRELQGKLLLAYYDVASPISRADVAELIALLVSLDLWLQEKGRLPSDWSR